MSRVRCASAVAMVASKRSSRHRCSPNGSAVSATTDRARFLDEAGRHLGLALATLVGALDLSEIVLSGPMDLLDDRFRTAALETIRHRTFPAVGQHVNARFSSLGDDGVLLGAAALVLRRELGVV